MREFGKAVLILILMLCIALFFVGFIWNLCYGTMPTEEAASAMSAAEQSQAWEAQYAMEQQSAVETTLRNEGNAHIPSNAVKEVTPEEQFAALRMKRDSAWQVLQDQLTELEQAEKEEYLAQYAQRRYKEQRLELLLQAKGIAHCLVILEEQQANVIVAEAELSEQYEKIFDLILRNTDFTAQEIVLLPLNNTAGNS